MVCIGTAIRQITNKINNQESSSTFTYSLTRLFQLRPLYTKRLRLRLPLTPMMDEIAFYIKLYRKTQTQTLGVNRALDLGQMVKNLEKGNFIGRLFTLYICILEEIFADRERLLYLIIFVG